ncbi:MAG: hypothetical protein IJD43_08830 [Thermoguttaceae bacterium]|nr:hypothetical protein [Thermoguttaceae bacterium]
MTESRERTRFLMENPDLIYWGAKRGRIPNRDWEDFRVFVLGESCLRPDDFDAGKASIVTYSARFVLLCAIFWKREKRKERGTGWAFSEMDRDDDGTRFVDTIAQPEEKPEERERREQAQDLIRWALFHTSEHTRRVVATYLFLNSSEGATVAYGISRQRVFQILDRFKREIRDLIRFNPPPPGFREKYSLADLVYLENAETEAIR